MVIQIVVGCITSMTPDAAAEQSRVKAISWDWGPCERPETHGGVGLEKNGIGGAAKGLGAC